MSEEGPLIRQIRLGGERAFFSMLQKESYLSFLEQNELIPIYKILTTPQCHQEIEDELIDFAVCGPDPTNTVLKGVPLFVDEFIIVGNQQWKQEFGKAKSKKDKARILNECQWVMYAEEVWIDQIRLYLSEMLGEKIVLNFHSLIKDQEFILGMVQQGTGLSVLPLRICSGLLQDKLLFRLFDFKSKLTFTQHLLWKDGKLRNKKHAKLHQFLIDFYQS